MLLPLFSTSRYTYHRLALHYLCHRFIPPSATLHPHKQSPLMGDSSLAFLCVPFALRPAPTTPTPTPSPAPRSPAAITFMYSREVTVIKVCHYFLIGKVENLDVFVPRQDHIY